jgi:D-alanyl-D-alanine carboxypeptidase
MLVFGGSLAAMLFGPSLLARLSPPSLLVEGIEEAPSTDGRLLGHFPYPEASVTELVTVEAGIELHTDAASSFRALQQAALADGVDLRLLSGYRSHALQKGIFFDVKSERNQTASERAKVSAPPGYSEHSTGFAMDLGDGDAPGTNLSQSFETTRAFRWLQDHAASYHFVLSFPPANPQGVSYEPWHWRFEGSAEALRRFEPARRLAQTP